MMEIQALYEIFKQYPSIQTDTRRLQKGDLYFALKGPSFNGNLFSTEAIQKGAAYAIVDDASLTGNSQTIVVADVLKTLQDLALHHRKQFSISFLAITGSNGKTTTKELIHVVLSTIGKTYTTEGNLNNHIGVPLTILKIKSDAKMAVIEMGANHQKEIESYCQYALPTHGPITNCGKAHLEGFGSEEGVKKGKGELFDHLRTHEGIAFIMKDYDYLIEMSKGIPTVISYGTHDASTTGHAVKTDPFLEVAFTHGYTGHIATSLVGEYNLPNVLAAVAIGKFFGADDKKIKEAIENYKPTNSRSQLLEKGSNKIILDAYNANPSSMKAAIENFAKAQGDNKILVLGSMAELGADSLQEHEILLKVIDKHAWKKVLLVGGDFLKVNHQYPSFASSKEAGEWIKENKLNQSFLLVKGSRSTQMEKVLDYL